VQRSEAEIRKHIKVEQQLKLYMDSLEEKVEELNNRLQVEEQKYVQVFEVPMSQLGSARNGGGANPIIQETHENLEWARGAVERQEQVEKQQPGRGVPAIQEHNHPLPQQGQHGKIDLTMQKQGGTQPNRCSRIEGTNHSQQKEQLRPLCPQTYGQS
jgi:hypothetical protein